MYLGKNAENETFFCNDIEMKNTTEEKILGVTIDNKFKFKIPIKHLCKKSLQKIWALSHLKKTTQAILRKG